MAWTPFALSHGVNPLFSHWLNVPYGANYAANVAIPLLGMVASPITAIWGPVAGTNFLISLAFFSSAVAGYYFVRHWTTWRPAAFFGGLLFGFSPYVVAEGIAHLHTMFVGPRPFRSSSCSTRSSSGSVTRTGSSAWSSGILVVAQYFISSEFWPRPPSWLVVAVVLVALFNRNQVAAHVAVPCPPWPSPSVIAAVVLAYPVLYSLQVRSITR